MMVSAFGIFFLLVAGYHCVAATEEVSPDEEQASYSGGGGYGEPQSKEFYIDAKEGNPYDPTEKMTCSAYNPNFCFAEHRLQIQDYLSPHVMEPDKLNEIRKKLWDGKVVVIENAFLPDFAESMHQELLQLNYSLFESYHPDGFHYSHHNVYDKVPFNPFLLAACDIFDSQQSKSFMSDLTGRDCNGRLVYGASWYAPGDHSLPHSDHVSAKTVAYVWHLSKNWLPEWGGALYWCPEENHHAYVHASFNTLTLFSVHVDTNHMVTQVSPHATENRLAWNGWWTHNFYPTPDEVIDFLDTPEKRRKLTRDHIQYIQEMLKKGDFKEDVKVRVESLMAMENAETFGPPKFIHRF
jgi:2OG-Fe(II) oxygenase superfamily